MKHELEALDPKRFHEDEASLAEKLRIEKEDAAEKLKHYWEEAERRRIADETELRAKLEAQRQKERFEAEAQ